MSDLRVTNLRGRTAGSAPTLPDGVVITGIATATTFSGNATGLSGSPNITVGIATVTTLSATTITATTYNGIPATSDWRDASLFS
jgi:hypothetical protein